MLEAQRNETCETYEAAKSEDFLPLSILQQIASRTMRENQSLEIDLIDMDILNFRDIYVTLLKRKRIF